MVRSKGRSASYSSHGGVIKRWVAPDEDWKMVARQGRSQAAERVRIAERMINKWQIPASFVHPGVFLLHI